MTMSQPSLDPVSFAIAIAGTLVGTQMAPFVGAYTVIIFAWLGGVFAYLLRKETMPRGKTAKFVLVTCIVTLGTTWVAATYLSAKVSIESTYLLFPIAFLIPAVGEDWIGLVRWGFNLWKGRAERAAGETKP
jgi:hypothetical protein